MKILNERPPIWDRAIAAFKFNPYQRVVFAWGDVIYNPNGAHMSGDLIMHESVHGLQHKAMGGPEIWWERYLVDAQFRLEQEIEAYGAQWRWLRLNKGRRAYDVREKIIDDLSGPLYGNIISREAAAAAIEEASMRDIFKVYS